MKGFIEVTVYNDDRKIILINCTNIICVYVDKSGYTTIDMTDNDYIHTTMSYDDIKAKIKEATE